jgi:PTS system N-acetylglucosamine-specific IIC component
MTSPLSALQPLGRALMLPIAVLPVAALLLRLGQDDILHLSFVAPLAHALPWLGPFIGSAGEAIFSNLGLLFAIGVAVGFARDNNGAAGLAGVVCFLVATAGAKSLIATPPEALKDVATGAHDLAVAAFKDRALSKLSVPLGILSGLTAGSFYNRFGNLKLPDYLAFFGGRRFVPIVSGFGGLGLGLVFGSGWGVLSSVMDGLSQIIAGSGPFGLFVYGVLNRVLIVTGLHHILNNVVYFLYGDYHGVTGDLNRFFAGDPTAGAFMAGYFPVMMFGLPAGCLAMYHTARPGRRQAVGGMLLSMAATAFLTGVTEPIEFSFMFLAPVLFGLHAVLTGLSMVLMDALRIRLGYGFSAGLLDYGLNFGRATRPLWLLPVGLAYAAIYYGLFRYFIQRFDLKTPGREDDPVGLEIASEAPGGNSGERFAHGLGGGANLIEVAACTTRLRLVMVDNTAIDEPVLRRLGAKGFIRPAAGALQVVLGPSADQTAGEIRAYLAQAPKAPGGPKLDAMAPVPSAPVGVRDIAGLIAALGGGANVLGVGGASSRLRVEVKDGAAVDVAALKAWGARAVAAPAPGLVHIILGPDAESVAAEAARFQI